MVFIICKLAFLVCKLAFSICNTVTLPLILLYHCYYFYIVSVEYILYQNVDCFH